MIVAVTNTATNKTTTAIQLYTGCYMMPWMASNAVLASIAACKSDQNPGLLLGSANGEFLGAAHFVDATVWAKRARYSLS